MINAIVFIAFGLAVPFIFHFAIKLAERAEKDKAAQARTEAERAAAAAAGVYIPNQIPLKDRIWNTVLSLFILGYGTFGIFMGELILAGKHGSLHIHGLPAWIMYAAMLCAVLNLLSVVVDHHDRRNNENQYRSFGKITMYAGLSLFVASLLSEVAWLLTSK